MEMHDKTTRVLHGEDELRAFISQTYVHVRDRLYTASDFVTDEIDSIADTGQFPYNSTVQRAIEKKLGIAQQDDTGSALSGVVYASQGYRRYRNLVAGGWQPLTPALIQKSHEQQRPLELLHESIFGNVILKLKVREIGGKLVAMQPGKRKYHVPPQGQPARIVA